MSAATAAAVRFFPRDGAAGAALVDLLDLDAGPAACGEQGSEVRVRAFVREHTHNKGRNGGTPTVYQYIREYQ